MADPAGRAAESWSEVAVHSLRRFRPQAQHTSLQPLRAETTDVRYSLCGVAESTQQFPTPASPAAIARCSKGILPAVPERRRRWNAQVSYPKSTQPCAAIHIPRVQKLNLVNHWSRSFMTASLLRLIAELYRLPAVVALLSILAAASSGFSPSVRIK